MRLQVTRERPQNRVFIKWIYASEILCYRHCSLETNCNTYDYTIYNEYLRM